MPIALKVLMVVGCSIRISRLDFGLLPKSELVGGECFWFESCVLFEYFLGDASQFIQISAANYINLAGLV